MSVAPGLLARLRLLFARPTTTAASLQCSRRRAARSALGFGLFTFLAASVGMAVALETVMPEWRDPEFGHRLASVRHANREFPDRPLVVVIGSSRAQNGILPSAMNFPNTPGSPRVFNFGQTASPPLKELLTLKRILDAGVKPRAVVVEIMPAMLMVDGPAEDQLGTQAARLAATDLRHMAPYCADVEALRFAWLAARAVPWYTQRQVLVSHWFPKWLPWQHGRIDFQWDSVDADGFQPLGEVSAEYRKLAIEHAKKEYVGAFTGFEQGAASVRAMRDLVATCRAEGIPVAFLIPPMSPWFRGSFAPGVYSAGEAHLLGLARRLDVPVFPAPHDMTEDEFRDGHHLLKPGAERYSRWLAENHLKPWLAKVLHDERSLP
jgi:hypothetical protein